MCSIDSTCLVDLLDEFTMVGKFYGKGIEPKKGVGSQVEPYGSDTTKKNKIQKLEYLGLRTLFVLIKMNITAVDLYMEF